MNQTQKYNTENNNIFNKPSTYGKEKPYNDHLKNMSTIETYEYVITNQ